MGLFWRRSYFALQEEKNGVAWERGPLYVWLPLLLIGFALLVHATKVRSPWLSLVSFQATSLAIIAFLWSWSGVRSFFAGWAFCWMALPLPGNLDVRLINHLREFTTSWSSSLLDYLGVLHRVNGNVIDIPGISLFIADACTGIHSLFVLITAAFFWGLWQRRTVPHTILLLLGTVSVVLIENVARVTLVTYLCESDTRYSEGWRHSLIGFALFGISLTLIASLDGLILFLLPVKDWSFIATLLGRDNEPLESPEPKPQEAPHATWPMYIYMSGLMLLGLIQLSWFPSQAKQFAMMVRRDPIVLPALTETTLPEQIMGWKRSGFETLHRIADDPMGEYSHRWFFEKGGRKAIVSLDYPYLRIHDLTICYQAVGWQVEDKQILQSDTNYPFVGAWLFQPLQGRSQLAFSLHSMDGHCEVAIDESLSVEQMLQRRFELDRPWFQIQSFASTSVSKEEANEDANALFLEARTLLLTHCARRSE